jgi:hypothetical protein
MSHRATFSIITMMVMGVGLLVSAAALAQDDPPKPGVVVRGKALYNDAGRDNITVSLTAEPTEKDKAPKPLTAQTNEKGEFEFRTVPIGKYRMTARGKPSSSLRKMRELDPVTVRVESATGDAITADIKLTVDR